MSTRCSKGRKGTKQVTVLFPNSDDVRWHNVDKYSVGEPGHIPAANARPRRAPRVCRRSCWLQLPNEAGHVSPHCTPPTTCRWTSSNG